MIHRNSINDVSREDIQGNYYLSYYIRPSF